MWRSLEHRKAPQELKSSKFCRFLFLSFKSLESECIENYKANYNLLRMQEPCKKICCSYQDWGKLRITGNTHHWCYSKCFHLPKIDFSKKFARKKLYNPQYDYMRGSKVNILNEKVMNFLTGLS